MNNSLMKLLFFLLLLACSHHVKKDSLPQSYYQQTQATLERGILNFEHNLNVEKYITNFPWPALKYPQGNLQSMLTTSYLLTTLPPQIKTNLVQIAITARKNLYQVSLKLKGNEHFKIERIYGYDDNISLLANEEVSIALGTITPKSPKVIIAEISGKEITGKRAPIRSTLLHQGGILTSASNISWKTGPLAVKHIDKLVLRNALLYANALTLIETSRLYRMKNFEEADHILNIQLGNLRIAQRWDQTGALVQEEATLLRIKKIISKHLKHGHDPSARLKNASPATILYSLRQEASQTAPGPWALIHLLIDNVLRTY